MTLSRADLAQVLKSFESLGKYVGLLSLCIVILVPNKTLCNCHYMEEVFCWLLDEEYVLQSLVNICNGILLCVELLSTQRDSK